MIKLSATDSAFILTAKNWTPKSYNDEKYFEEDDERSIISNEMINLYFEQYLATDDANGIDLVELNKLLMYILAKVNNDEYEMVFHRLMDSDFNCSFYSSYNLTMQQKIHSIIISRMRHLNVLIGETRLIEFDYSLMKERQNEY